MCKCKSTVPVSFSDSSYRDFQMIHLFLQQGLFISNFNFSCNPKAIFMCISPLNNSGHVWVDLIAPSEINISFCGRGFSVNRTGKPILWMSSPEKEMCMATTKGWTFLYTKLSYNLLAWEVKLGWSFILQWGTGISLVSLPLVSKYCLACRSQGGFSNWCGKTPFQKKCLVLDNGNETCDLVR